ncbi:DUF397 domain-containing protein [Streptomyces humidus]|uniref:DUF397 domain-containing protein n=1 Tax=Streptomyces humidus TaxID=52259 RepID=UPI0033313291
MTTGTGPYSTFSGGAEGSACAELAASPVPSAPHLRESEEPGTALTTTPAALAHLLAGIRAGLGR